MATKVPTFIDDPDDDLTSTAPAKPAVVAQVSPPAPTSPAPTQQPGPPPPPPQQPTATMAAAPVAAPAPVVADDEEDIPAGGRKAAAKQMDDYDVSFGDEKLMSRSDGLDICRPDKGKTVRFALLTNYVPAKRAFNHFIDKKGTYHCLSTMDAPGTAICCKRLGESTPQIVALVLQYTNADPKTGRYVKNAETGHLPPIQWEIKFVRLSRSAFRRVSNLVEEDGQPTDIDIIMNHRDSGIGYEYNKISAARWLKNPALVAEVEAAIQPFKDGKKLLSKLGKKVSLLEFRAVLAGQTSDEEPDMSKVDDI